MSTVEIIVAACLVALVTAGYFIVRDWSVLPLSSRAFTGQMVPYFVVFSVLGFLLPLFWGVSALIVAFCLIGEIGGKWFPPPIYRPSYLPDPIGVVTCKIRVHGRRVRRVKGELLPSE